MLEGGIEEKGSEAEKEDREISCLVVFFFFFFLIKDFVLIFTFCTNHIFKGISLGAHAINF